MAARPPPRRRAPPSRQRWPVPSCPPPPPPPRPNPNASPPAPDPIVVRFLDELRIAGIRASDTDPRVLMNDRIYRQGDIVDSDTGLRLTRIEPSRLGFEDARGAIYSKSF